MIRTSILPFALIVLLAACGGESETTAEVNPCNCFHAMESGDEKLAAIIEPCNKQMESEDFMLEYQRCKLADMRGVPVEDVKIPETAETEKPVLEIPSAGSYSVDGDQSSVQWTGSKITGEKHTGKLSVSSGSISIDGNTLQSGKVMIDMTSLTDTDIKDDAERAKLEGHLKSADFFDVASHPEAVFEFDSPANLENYRAMLDGTLTIRGVSQKVQAPVSVVGTSNGSMILSGAMIINRTDFNVKFGSSAAADFFIKDEFAINFNFHGSPAQ